MYFKKLLSLIALLSLPFGVLANFVAPEKPGLPGGQSKDGAKNVSFARPGLTFEENRGQVDLLAKFISRAPGYHAFFATDEVVFQLKFETGETVPNPRTATPIPATSTDTLRMRFAGGKANKITGADQLITKTNYYHARTRLENIPNFGRVNYERIYEGIDAVFYGTSSGALEYDFNIAPNADPSQIKLEFDGAERVTIDNEGNLIIKTANTQLVQNKPFAYQLINGEKREVKAEYVITEQSQIANQKSQIRFSLGDYDRTLPLVIDPVVDYLTYLGGSGIDEAYEITADASGNAYVSGNTASTNFHGRSRDADDGSGVFVGKLNSDGSAFEYITILEGNDDDFGHGIALDGAGNAYVVGDATRDFPVTSGAFDTYVGFSNGEGFAAKLSPTGTLVYATYIGGSAIQDTAFDVAVDAGGKAYVVGVTQSGTTFPQKNEYQGCGASGANTPDAFLTVLNQTATDITYSTCFGSSVIGLEDGFALALDSSNNAIIGGRSSSGNIPIKNAFQPERGGGADGFVAKFNPAASGDASLVYSSYLGGVGTDQVNGIAIDSVGQAYAVGFTGSVDFPLVNAFDTTNQINEAFITVISQNGTSILNSSFLGGADRDLALNVALDPTGTIYIVGKTHSNDFPTVSPFQPTRRGLFDGFITKLKFGRGIISSSYVGGNGDDVINGVFVKGNFTYISGRSESTNLATTPGVLKETTDNDDGFVAKILDTQLDSVGVFRPATTFSLTQSIVNVVPVTPGFTSLLAGQRGVSGDWDGDGIDSIGSFTNGTWKVRNVNFPVANVPAFFGGKTITFGQTGDLPVVGDWNNDGIDTPGVFRPSTGQFLLTNSISTAPPVDVTLNFGLNGDLPVGGDWNADGVDTVGVFRPSTGQFFLTDDSAGKASIDQTFFFGINGDLPVGGDWNGDGVDTVGVFRTSTTEFFLTNDNINFSNVFTFGQINDQPIVGDWDGRSLP